jgi:O-antigen/teichoic acid export membrane protein
VAGAPDVLDTGEAGGKAIRGGALRSGAYGVALLLSLASVPLMVRHLGAVDYGAFVTVSSIMFIVGGITEAGLTNLGIRRYAVLDGADRDAFLRQLAGLRFALTALGVLVATAFVWITGAREEVVQGTFISGIGLLVALTQQTYSIPLTAQLRLGWISALDLVKQALLTVLIVLLVVVGAGLVPFFWTSVGASAGALALTLALVRGDVPLRPAVDLAVWRSVMREVLPYSLAAAVGLVYLRLGVILMSYVAPELEAGLYATAFRIVEVLGVIPWLAVSSGFPILARAARDDAQRLRYALQKLFDVSVVAGVGLVLVIIAGAPLAIDVVGGPGFEGATPVLRWLAGALLTSFLVATWSFALLSLERYRDLLVCNAIAVAATAGAVLALEPPLGPEGAAIGTVLGEGALAVAYLVALRRAAPELTPSFGVAGKALLAAVAPAAALLLPVGPIVAGAVVAVLYVAGVVTLRAVPPELVRALLRRAP